MTAEVREVTELITPGPAEVSQGGDVVIAEEQDLVHREPGAYA